MVFKATDSNSAASRRRQRQTVKRELGIRYRGKADLADNEMPVGAKVFLFFFLSQKIVEYEPRRYSCRYQYSSKVFALFARLPSRANPSSLTFVSPFNRIMELML